MNTNNFTLEKSTNSQLKYIVENINNLKADNNNKIFIRKIMNELKEYFLNKSFDDIRISFMEFTQRDIGFFGENYNDICTIHTTDNLAFFLYVNDKFRRKFGFKKGFIIGKCIYCLIHKNDFQEVSETHDKVLNGSDICTSYRFLTNFRNKDGKKIYKKVLSQICKVDNIIITRMKDVNETDKTFYKTKFIKQM